MRPYTPEAGTLELLTPPEDEPLDLEDAKEHLKEDSSEFNDYITGLITAARMYVEAHTGRGLIDQTWRLTLDSWPSRRDEPWWDGVREGAITDLHFAQEVTLAKAPFKSVSEVRTLDEDGTETVWAASNYYTATRSGFGRLVAKTGSTFPIPDRDVGGIQIDFLVGYGENASDVPYPIRQAMKQLIFHWFRHRLAVDQCISGSVQGAPHVPFGVVSLLAPYVVHK
ncbi:MAG: hypothetical protein ACLFU3_08575 [Dichotomicrobium sp.]